MLRNIAGELKHHIPFTVLGSVAGIAVFAVFVYTGIPRAVSTTLFQTFHPLHVFLSAIATASMYRLHAKRSVWATIVVGYVGAVGIATLSDSVIPYLGELLLGTQYEGIHAEVHAGFLHEWWLVNPLALIGALIAFFWPRTKFSHAGHVLLSVAASLFHMLMAFDHGHVDPLMLVLISIFLFIAVWIPCCASDIVFPLLFAPEEK